MIVLTVPIPPSVNEMYANNRGAGRGRHKTKRYKTWERAALNEIAAQKIERIDGPVEVSILVQRRRSNSDLDNRIKPLLDFLQVCGVIEDDKNVVKLHAEWAPIQGASVTVKKPFAVLV